ncbi:MAG: HAD-IB family phosphatase [Chitinophagaceae bacterium]|nr:HAD-IB family phosphatase [Chitinophagaceae bacterium]MBK8298946.1 HAD-IB family phosphatase [Chitinophagaceae bacterium]MBK9464768.1 HAD-IB family phosphatase [Chitinophagaceae bacterium]MBK9938026.1 HAD-IB family phosphatase [Chitinophagaceae bacterium]
MITVIIPALNEEATVGYVVRLAKNSPNVSEVIVVDDKSMDNTIEEARREGASVITSTKLGKGTSMKDGVLVAKNEVIAFLDADIVTYSDDIIQILTSPIINGKADFVKSYFTRQAGRVTELVAKPLLSILYPSFPNFQQPLSGMIAGKKSFFEKCEFEEGYGVDIGILIDMYNLNARISEVSIGNIENRMQALEQLGKMSREVARTIMKKSKGIEPQNLETFENIQVIREQMEFAIREGLMSLKKVAIFDMDNTILRASFINTAASAFGFKNELVDIVTNNHNPFIRTKMIARLLKGKSIGDLLELTDSIDVTPNLTETIVSLKGQGYITGIISDSYDCITNHLKNKFGFDFTISNELEFSKSIATGEVKIPSLFLQDEKSQCKHEYCKLNALINICEKYGVDLKNTLVVGDGENDICVIRKAGIGISFCSTNIYVDSVADYVIKEADFELLLPIFN